MTTVVNQVPYLRTSRNFPEDLNQLTIEVNKAYVDTANAINGRVIGIFPTTKPAINGETWYLIANQRQQGLRQVYPFTSTVPINHNISIETIGQFVRGFGTYTDGTNSYGLIYASNIPIAGQISFYVTNTQIIFVPGIGAPAVISGVVDIEWLSAA